jgi:hypothetical protein
MLLASHLLPDRQLVLAQGVEQAVEAVNAHRVRRRRRGAVGSQRGHVIRQDVKEHSDDFLGEISSRQSFETHREPRAPFDQFDPLDETLCRVILFCHLLAMSGVSWPRILAMSGGASAALGRHFRRAACRPPPPEVPVLATACGDRVSQAIRFWPCTPSFVLAVATTGPAGLKLDTAL